MPDRSILPQQRPKLALHFLPPYMTKHDAYQWLGELLGVPAKNAHIAQLGVLSCNLVIREATKLLDWYRSKKNGKIRHQPTENVRAS